jgi:tripartite ATP-independent transporter DctM subunit
MDPLILGFGAFGILLILFMLGVQIGIGMALIGFLGVWAMTGNFSAALGILRTTPFFAVANFNYTVMPLFILMGLFCSYGGIGGDAFKAVRNSILAKLPGGLAVATVWASCIFGAASGSAYAAAAVFTKISLPEMEKANYDVKFSCGAIASASALAVLIPPSLMFLIYAIVTEQSIAKLLIAGIGPGLLFALLLSISIVLMAASNPRLAPTIPMAKQTFKESVRSVSGVWSILLLALIVLGGIYSGVFSATEAGAVGAFAAMMIAVFSRRLNKTILIRSMAETAETTCMLFFVLIGAQIFTTFLASSGFSDRLVLQVTGSEVAPLIIVAGLMLMYLFLGCFLDGIAMMVITLPIVFPIILHLGLSPIWFGALMIMVGQLGSLTPPFGMSVFIVQANSGGKISSADAFKGAVPFMLVEAITLALLISFPGITTFLPDRM